jgi:hypothetical protein
MGYTSGQQPRGRQRIQKRAKQMQESWEQQKILYLIVSNTEQAKKISIEY